VHGALFTPYSSVKAGISVSMPLCGVQNQTKLVLINTTLFNVDKNPLFVKIRSLVPDFVIYTKDML